MYARGRGNKNESEIFPLSMKDIERLLSVSYDIGINKDYPKRS